MIINCLEFKKPYFAVEFETLTISESITFSANNTVLQDTSRQTDGQGNDGGRASSWMVVGE
jgi:hypothetical protein